MFEKIRCQIMNRLYTKHKEATEKWRGKICPKVRKKVERHAEYAGGVDVFPSGGGVFSVKKIRMKYMWLILMFPDVIAVDGNSLVSPVRMPLLASEKMT